MSALRRMVHEVHAIEIGTNTRYEQHQLVVGQEQALALFADPALASVRLHVAAPGDRVRIVAPLDVVEPRSKGPGGGVFPGWMAPVNRPRGGDTHVLRGAAVLAAGHLPRNQEGLIDMSGPAADRSPFARTNNVVIEFDRADGASWQEAEVAVRRGLLRLAVHLADAAVEASPDVMEELAPPHHPGTPTGGLPRVGVITNLQTQGAFKDVFVYGHSMAGSLPTLFDPVEIEDGAVVSGQYGHPALRNPTYLHQNHPVIAELRARNGQDLCFAGVVLCPEPVEQAAKELVSTHAAWLCRAAGFDAVIVTKEGAGNADNDLMLKVDALEADGLTAVALYAELSGADGTGPPLVAGPRRGAIISTGNYDQRIKLPAVERAIGGSQLRIADADATAAVEIPTAAILSALSPLGAGWLTCRPEQQLAGQQLGETT
ncbi:MAG TPA: glycine/sarcosine/betaine reductase component B subunit [Pseudonocardiaceae bacterium]|nr:glycine/sarcosine/betaine reductase component B subunit [Pseudonocardiaceae bacterium]